MSFSRAHFSILTLPMIAAKFNRNCCGDQGDTRIYSASGEPHLSLKDSRSSKTCSRGRDSASSLSIKKPTPTPHEAPSSRVAKVEPARVPSRKLRGVPPQLTHLGEPEAGRDALHVREDHGRDIQVGIERGLVRVDLALTASELHGGVARARVGGRRGSVGSSTAAFFPANLVSSEGRLGRHHHRAHASPTPAWRAGWLA